MGITLEHRCVTNVLWIVPATGGLTYVSKVENVGKLVPELVIANGGKSCVDVAVTEMLEWN